jgi:uncharacterized protein YqhQ
MNKQFNYGGQAVLEGVMMRGSHHMAVAVRAPYGYRSEAIKALKEAYPVLNLDAEPSTITEIAKAFHLPEFDRIIAEEGAVVALRIPDGVSLDAKTRLDLVERAKLAGVRAAATLTKGDTLLSEESVTQTLEAVKAEPPDLILLLADVPRIVVHEEPLTSSLYNGALSKIPFVRGLGLLWDSLGLGIRALLFSADVAAGDEADFNGPIAWGTIAISFMFSIGIFFLLPAAIAAGLHSLFNIESALIGNLTEGLIRLALVIGYISLAGRLGEMQRVYAYHGAEHKAINAYEDDAPLTPESVARYPLEHPRCGTGFLLVVVIISVLIFSLLGRPPLLLRLASRVVLIPVVAGVAYEYIRLLARNLNNPIARILVKPQLALQRLTTREPSYQMLEVSICALRRVLESEQLPMPEAPGEPAVVSLQ